MLTILATYVNVNNIRDILTFLIFGSGHKMVQGPVSGRSPHDKSSDIF